MKQDNLAEISKEILAKERYTSLIILFSDFFQNKEVIKTIQSLPFDLLICSLNVTSLENTLSEIENLTNLSGFLLFVARKQRRNGNTSSESRKGFLITTTLLPDYSLQISEKS